MAQIKSLILLFIALLFTISSASSTAAQVLGQTFRVPVFHRDELSASPANATAAGLHRRRLDDDIVRYNFLRSNASGAERLHVPVTTGFPYSSGEYFALIGVGTPAISALLVIDTGSDIVWMQCAPCNHCYNQVSPVFDPRQSSTFKTLSCKSPRCTTLTKHGCNNQKDVCHYIASYGDGSTSTGVLASDRLLFSSNMEVHDIALGCGTDNHGLFESSAGLLGLGRGKPSFASQIASQYGKVFAYCFGDRNSHAVSKSYLEFGDPAELPNTTYTPMLRNKKLPSFYYVDVVGFSIGNKWIPAGGSLTLNQETGKGGLLVDSGTTISRLSASVYYQVRNAFRAAASKKGMRKSPQNYSIFDTCYNLGSPRSSTHVPSFVMHLAGGGKVNLQPHNYLLQVGEEYGAPPSTFCFGIVGAEEGINIWGNAQQQGFRVVYDIGKLRIGFAPEGCLA